MSHIWSHSITTLRVIIRKVQYQYLKSCTRLVFQQPRYSAQGWSSVAQIPPSAMPRSPIAALTQCLAHVTIAKESILPNRRFPSAIASYSITTTPSLSSNAIRPLPSLSQFQWALDWAPTQIPADPLLAFIAVSRCAFSRLARASSSSIQSLWCIYRLLWAGERNNWLELNWNSCVWWMDGCMYLTSSDVNDLGAQYFKRCDFV